MWLTLEINEFNRSGIDHYLAAHGLRLRIFHSEPWYSVYLVNCDSPSAAGLTLLRLRCDHICSG
jgi:hypothetical protein